MFGTYKTGEIDFFVSSIKNENDYGIEVKAVYFLKGDTYGGLAGRMVTVPVYLVGRVGFEFEN